jgi:hypothetical protein
MLVYAVGDDVTATVRFKIPIPDIENRSDVENSTSLYNYFELYESYSSRESSGYKCEKYG